MKLNTSNMLGRVTVGVLCLATPAMVTGYEDRRTNEDDYFGARMQEHNQGRGLYQEPQGRGNYVLVLGALAGAGIEWFWTGRAIKKETQKQNEASAAFVAKWHKDRDALMTRRTYPIKLLAHQVEEAELQLMQLVAAAEDAGVDMGIHGGSGGAMQSGRVGARSVHQDNLEYEEFRQPDVNGDNVISKLEFDAYINKYVTMYPETLAGDIPRFEDFDLNRDGVVTFDEWQTYLDQHRQVDQYAENDLLQGMYDTSAQSQGFNSLAQNLNRAQMRGGRY